MPYYRLEYRMAKTEEKYLTKYSINIKGNSRFY